MSLHLFLGVVNLLYKMLEKILQLISFGTLKADDWASSCYLVRDGHYGGELMFEGPSCHILLKNQSKLVSLLTQHGLLEQCQPWLDAFEALQNLIKSCFGMELLPRYVNDIRAFADAFFNLMNYCNGLNHDELNHITLNVIPKVHAIFVHIKQFIELQKETHNFDFGLGFYTEQP